MAQTRKFASLPDLDSAPDIYETPELTDDTSTLRASSTVRSPSSASSYDDAQEDASGIDRRHVQAGQARTRFKPARVDARDVDFSDRLTRQRKSYQTSSRRRRTATGSDEELGDFSDEEDESLERKLARLRREIEEAKVELQEKESDPAAGAETDGRSQDTSANLASEEEISKLSEMLDSVYTQHRGAVTGAEAQYMSALSRLGKTAATEDGQTQAFTSPTTQQSFDISPEQRAQVLSKAADLDKRLASLETALGLDANTMPDVSSNAQKPILHALNNLDRHISTISSASSTDILDSASRKIRQLTQEADRLVELRQSSSSSSSTTLTSSRDAQSTKTNGVKSASEDVEGNSKINALYGTLSTIENISPSLPMILERLRTLRLIHASAGDASTTLDELEKRQSEQAAEIERWRNALQKVETSMSEGEGVLTTNVKLVGEWVKELEARVEKLA